jgi:dihydroxyacid dehydratase/phosphogluconate dehydratase
VSTGACVGHCGPEALAGGPIANIREGDRIRIVLNRADMTGSVDFVGTPGQPIPPEAGAEVLAARSPHPELRPHPALPDDTRLWAALQNASGGTWGGCVYDVEAILSRLQSAP